MFPRLLAALLLFTLPALAAPKRLLLIGQGPDGHPVTTHEFMGGVRVIEALMKPYAAEIQTTITKANEPWPEGPGLLDQADGVVLMVTQGARFMQSNPERWAAFQRLAARKGAIVALHWSIGAKDAEYIPGQLALLGGTRGGTQRKYKVLENDVHLVDPKNPILRGISDFRINDEFYYNLDLATNEPGFHPLFKTTIDGKEEVVCWSLERANGGRSFGYVGYHFHKNWERVEYRRLAAQAILWCFDLPIPEKGADVEVDPKVYELPHAFPPGTIEPLTEAQINAIVMAGRDRSEIESILGYPAKESHHSDGRRSVSYSYPPNAPGKLAGFTINYQNDREVQWDPIPVTNN